MRIELTFTPKSGVVRGLHPGDNDRPSPTLLPQFTHCYHELMKTQTAQAIFDTVAYNFSNGREVQNEQYSCICSARTYSVFADTGGGFWDSNDWRWDKQT